MYDFLLFENYHLASHHIYDLVLIARMMQSQGMSVAIFDIFHEIKEDEIEGIPVIHWHSQFAVPDDSWMLYKHSLWDTVIRSIKQRIQTHRYFKEVVAFAQDKATAFYCGSYHNGISTQLFKIQKPCYYWGLRSYRLAFTWRKLIPNPIGGLHILLEHKRFLQNPYQRLFVSNPIIMEEHERLGIPCNRMVIREERVVEKRTDANLEALDGHISFLVIGQLREQKHIPTTVIAFKRAKLPNARLKLVGRSQENYEKVIQRTIDGDERIERVNEYLEYEDFYRYFSQSHFVLFADEQDKSCITNGTMMEALIHHRPIICPDHNPYSYYINEYGIGILYKAGNVDSYADALEKATELGVVHFQEKINAFLETLIFEKVAKQFVHHLKKQIQ